MSKNLTPEHMRCGVAQCASIHELEDGRLLIVGACAHDAAGYDDAALNRAYGGLIAGEGVGPGETAIIIDRALLANVLK